MKYITLFLFLTSCNPFNWYPDSPFEEEIEQKIKGKTGVRVDLSGDTPDKDDPR